jgi:DNA-binding response OmpR family regulator
VPRVLIVDDEPDVLLMLRVNLEADGFETALAADGETALQRVGDDHFDLMLLDVMMPVMDGWGVLEALPTVADPPKVIVVSAKSSYRDVCRAIESGAVDFVTKPFSAPELAALVQRVVALGPGEVDAYRHARLARITPAGA